jgi:hypothetical protein
MTFTDYLNATADVWRNANASGETSDAYADAPTSYSLVASEPCRVTIAARVPGRVNRVDRGFGQALVALPRVSFLPDANVQARDVIHTYDGPQPDLWLRVPDVKVAQGPQAAHHIVIEGEPVHLRFEEEAES